MANQDDVMAVPTGAERPCGCPWNVCPHGGPMWIPGYDNTEPEDSCEGQDDSEPYCCGLDECDCHLYAGGES